MCLYGETTVPAHGIRHSRPSLQTQRQKAALLQELVQEVNFVWNYVTGRSHIGANTYSRTEWSEVCLCSVDGADC